MATIGGVGCRFLGHEKREAEPNETTESFDALDVRAVFDVRVCDVRDAAGGSVGRAAPAVVLRMDWADGTGLRAAVVPSVVGVLHATATTAATTIAGRSTVPKYLRRIVIRSCDRDARLVATPSRSRCKATWLISAAELAKKPLRSTARPVRFE